MNSPIVDPACMDLGRSVELARHVVDETGIQLVMCTGIYGSHYTFLPQHFQNRELQARADDTHRPRAERLRRR